MPRSKRQAQATKSYQEFGLLAEKISEDDFHVNMGDHRSRGPRQVAAPNRESSISHASRTSERFDPDRKCLYYFPIECTQPGTEAEFRQVKNDVRAELQKSKYERLRSNLAKRLRAKAKIEIV